MYYIMTFILIIFCFLKSKSTNNDFKPNALATMAKENTHTKYYTIPGTCFPWIGDGLVSTSSVNSKPYFKSLGTSNACHLELLDDYEYELAHDIVRNIE